MTNVKEKTTSMTELVVCFMLDKRCYLSDLVDSFCQAGYLSCRGILVVNALACRLVDLGDRLQKSSGSSLFIVLCDSSLNLLYISFYSGLDRFVSGCFGLCYQDSFLSGFDISQSVHLQCNRTEIYLVTL